MGDNKLLDSPIKGGNRQLYNKTQVITAGKPDPIVNNNQNKKAVSGFP